MVARRNRKRVKTVLIGETLETRRLLTAAVPALPAAEVHLLNHLARFREGEPPGEPSNPARTEPRPPGITKGHLDRGITPPRAPQLFIEPRAGRTVILEAINSARRQIRLGICVLSDPTIGNALIAAYQRGVQVRIIVDRGEFAMNTAEQREVAQLVSAGIPVHLSNPIFPQSYEKELVIDQRRVLIMTMCLETATFQDTRDYGLVLAAKTSSMK